MTERSGELDRDSRGEAIQYGTYFSVSDGTGTPKVSPIALPSAATGVSATVPIGAIAMQVYPTQQTFVAHDASATSAHGFLMTTIGLPYRFPVKGGSIISFASNATAAGSISFAFEMLNAYTSAQNG